MAQTLRIIESRGEGSGEVLAGRQPGGTQGVVGTCGASQRWRSGTGPVCGVYRRTLVSPLSDGPGLIRVVSMAPMEAKPLSLMPPLSPLALCLYLIMLCEFWIFPPALKWNVNY